MLSSILLAAAPLLTHGHVVRRSPGLISLPMVSINDMEEAAARKKRNRTKVADKTNKIAKKPQTGKARKSGKRKLDEGDDGGRVCAPNVEAIALTRDRSVLRV